MSIEYKRNVAHLQGIVTVDEAESLLEWLQGRSKAKVDLSACSHLHCANLLILLVIQPAIAAWPADETLANWLKTSLATNRPV